MYINIMYSNMFSPICFYNFISKTISVVTTITLGVGISVVIVSLFLGKNKYKTHKYLLDESSSDESSSDNDDNDDDNDDNDDNNYEDKYKNEFNNLDNNDISDNELNFIEDMTPNGIIKMSFDVNRNCFIYYTNNKDNIPYKYLETVGRLFVINNDCKKIYINYEDELNKIIANQEKMDDESKTNDKEEINEGDGKEISQKSVFAKLKNYKTKMTNISSKKWIIPERINQYRYMGKLDDYEESIKTDKNNDFECIDYSTFKKLKDN